MNLPRVFTLEQANLELPEVLRITHECIEQLAAVSAAWGKLPFRKYNALAGATEESVIHTNWARRIGALGILPKGFFVIDFASPDDNIFYCWAYGEECVAHEHKVWETFADRRPIEIGRDLPTKPYLSNDVVGGKSDLGDEMRDGDAMPDETTRDET